MQAAITPNEQLAAQTKLALRRLASAVAVVSCRYGQTRHAMTATAVNAMSMDPPSMIVCVNRATTFHGAISAATRFAINILHRNHIDISMGCGGKTRGDDRFGHGAWGEEAEVPILTDAQACVVCTKEAKFDYGSHTIFIGRVMSIGIYGEVDPLIYVDGRYTCLPPDAIPASAIQTQIEMLRQLAM
jgi:flavin reductase (DIM6/NTAB) family NADH-FMN oxidoreductase RutF